MKHRSATGLLKGCILLLPILLIAGCGLNSAPVLHPKGPIALAERDLLFTALGFMMIVVIPVWILAALFAWRYRAGGRGKYTPDWSYSVGIDAVIWLVPAAIIVVLGYLVWTTTHRLDPYLRLDESEQPIRVQVVAQDWKWLFLYPQYGVASVNELAFPASRPLSLSITSDTVMNSFMVPALGGQIYAMAGMTTRLNLLADAPGEFAGRNTQYSGDGFSDQHFVARGLSDEDFDDWVEIARQSPKTLDSVAYTMLAAPSVAHPVEYFSGFEPDLFGTILQKYAAGPHQNHGASGQNEGG